MKKSLTRAIMLISIFILVGCRETAEEYTQFTDINFVVDLLNEAPTMEQLEELGIDLINSGVRRSRDTREINQRIRDRASTVTSRTTGTVWGPHGIEVVDLTTVTTRYVPDSELNLHDERVVMTNVWETDGLPRGARSHFNQFGQINFQFATIEGMETDRLFEVSIHGIDHYFHGIDFSQFNDGYTRAEILDILITRYGLDAEMLFDGPVRSRYMEPPSTGIIFYYENVQFILRNPETRAMRIQASLLSY